MNVTELYDLSNWVRENLQASKLKERFNSLHIVLQRNTQANQQKQEFLPQKDALLDSIRSWDLRQVSKEQRTVLDRHGLLDLIGPTGVQYVENALFHDAVDIAAAARMIGDALTRIDNASAAFELLHESLAEIIDDEDSSEIESDDQVVVRVYFANGVAIDNVVDFKKLSAQWHDIARGFAMAHGAKPEDVSVIGAQSGSIIIDLATFLPIAKTVSWVVEKILDYTEKIVEIRSQVQQVRALKLSNDKAALELEKEIEKHKKDAAQVISSEITGTLKVEGEEKTALIKSVEKLLDFFDRGGRVDFVVPDGADDESESSVSPTQLDEFRQRVHAIRESENRIRLLKSHEADDQRSGE